MNKYKKLVNSILLTRKRFKKRKSKTNSYKKIKNQSKIILEK